MKEIILDKDILQKEVNALLHALRGYSASVEQSLSERFADQARDAGALMDDFKASLVPRAGEDIVDAINKNNRIMLDRVIANNAGYETARDAARFFEAVERKYVHGKARGIFGQRDGVRAAKEALHNYIDAAFLYYSVCGHGGRAPVSCAVTGAFRQKGHEYLDSPLRIVSAPAAPVAR